MLVLILGLSDAHVTVEKWCNKRHSVFAYGPTYIEVIFAFLRKVIAVYKQFFFINIWKPSFKKMFIRFFWWQVFGFYTDYWQAQGLAIALAGRIFKK